MDKQEKLIAQLFKDTFIVFVVSTLTATLGNLIDGILISKFLGTEAIAAFGLTIPYQKFTAMLPAIIALGMQVLCSKSLGSGNLREANQIFSLATTFTFVLSILMTAGTFLFTQPILDILGVEKGLGNIPGLAADYLQAYSLCLPAMALGVVFMPLMQLDCDRQRTIIAITSMSICNVICDAISIFVLEGGMWGIGIATVVSYWLALAILSLHFIKPDTNFFYTIREMNFRFFRDMTFIGFPIILGRISSTLQSGFFNRMAVALASGVGVAAYAVIGNFFGLLEIIPKSLGSATQMISGILIGEQDRNSILRLFKIALKYSLILSLTTTAAAFLAAPVIADIYIRNDPPANQMVVEGIRLAVAFLPFYTIATVFQYFHQAYGRFKLVSVLSVVSNIGFIVPIILLLKPHFGIAALWLAFPLNAAAYLLTIFFITCRHCGRITFRLEDYLLLPDDFDVPEDSCLDITVTTKKEVLGLSETAQAFCEEKGIDERRSMFAGICIEEMASNIVDYGFNDGKKHFVDVRIIVDGNRVIIRIRDDCRPFNPKKWVEIYNSEDPSSHIGIRLCRKIATEFNYVNILKLNNLIIKI
ncbi:MAG: ATP-binding protein [Selenomonadaceae bacterium]|nr:ATP-binding protein [Selenomonadaceae bacterium]